MSGLRVIKPGVSSLQRHVRRLNQVDASQPHFHITPWLPAWQVQKREGKRSWGRLPAHTTTHPLLSSPPPPPLVSPSPGPETLPEHMWARWRERGGVSQWAKSRNTTDSNKWNVISWQVSYTPGKYLLFFSSEQKKKDCNEINETNSFWKRIYKCILYHTLRQIGTSVE